LPEEARRRFEGAIDQSPLTAETVRITQALGRVLASDLAAETDVPAFDRASVDGFAVRRPTPSGRVIAHPDGFCSMRK
jgi:molybdopterin molybdotransferase/putative molybdopterin biosynthesis protein